MLIISDVQFGSSSRQCSGTPLSRGTSLETAQLSPQRRGPLLRARLSESRGTWVKALPLYFTLPAGLHFLLCAWASGTGSLLWAMATVASLYLALIAEGNGAKSRSWQDRAERLADFHQDMLGRDWEMEWIEGDIEGEHIGRSILGKSPHRGSIEYDENSADAVFGFAIIAPAFWFMFTDFTRGLLAAWFGFLALGFRLASLFVGGGALLYAISQFPSG